jgi:hypothetical protein
MTVAPIIIDTQNIIKSKDNAIAAVIHPTLIAFFAMSTVMIFYPNLHFDDTIKFFPFLSVGIVELILCLLVFIIAIIVHTRRNKKNNLYFNKYFPTLKREIQAKYNIEVTMDEVKRIMANEEFIKISSTNTYVYFTLTPVTKNQFSLVVTMNTEIPVPYKPKN